MTGVQIQYTVNKSDIADIASVESRVPTLSSGQILLELSLFAFTSNNISYAVMGDKFGYWQFFPSGQDGRGVIPVWGFATVAESRHEAILPGERVYGYFPMATHMLAEPTDISERRFTDGTAHRQPLPEIYNQYTRLPQKPGASQELDPWRALFYPLAGTAFGLHDWLQQSEEGRNGDIILVSASSKTALSLAALLKETPLPGRRVIGLTSRRNAAAITGIGYYDEVVSYDVLERIDASRPAVLIDFSGNGDILSALHRQLADNMRHTCIVGASHWDEVRRGEGYITDRAALFFMPAYAAERIRQTGGEFAKNLRAAGELVTQMASQWMTLEEAHTPEQLEQLYNKVMAGQLDPATGGIVHASAMKGKSE